MSASTHHQGRARFRDGPISISPGAGPTVNGRTLMGTYPPGTYTLETVAGEVHVYRTPDSPRTGDAGPPTAAEMQARNRAYWAARGA